MYDSYNRKPVNIYIIAHCMQSTLNKIIQSLIDTDCPTLVVAEKTAPTLNKHHVAITDVDLSHLKLLEFVEEKRPKKNWERANY